METGESRDLEVFWNSQFHRGVVYAGSQSGNCQKDRKGEGERHSGEQRWATQGVVKGPVYGNTESAVKLKSKMSSWK